jgi:uncharacterized protein (TIGR03382 family)
MTRTLSLATAAVAALLASASANAAIVTFDFDLFAQDASLIGSGSFSFDDAVLDAAGDGAASPVNGDLTLSATIFGIAFDESNDIDFDDFPVVGVAGGAPIFLDLILNQGVNGVDFTGVTFDGRPVVGVRGGSVTGIGDAGQLLIDGEVSTADVPAPAALALFGLGLVALGARRRG